MSGDGSDDFDPVRSAREVVATAPTGGLATLEADGFPFASFVTVGTTPPGAPTVLISALAQHTRNLLRDPRASLILVAPGGETGNPLAGARLTVTGTFERDDDRPLRRRFVARNPSAAPYEDFHDFTLWRLVPKRAHLVAGFGRIVDLSPEELLLDVASAPDVVAGEEDILAHMNADHRDTLSLYAEKLLGRRPGNWRATGSDPAGLDLALGGERARLWYPTPAASPGAVRHVLKALADQARAK